VFGAGGFDTRGAFGFDGIGALGIEPIALDKLRRFGRSDIGDSSREKSHSGGAAQICCAQS
jgi:hypothetical protein